MAEEEKSVWEKMFGKSPFGSGTFHAKREDADTEEAVQRGFNICKQKVELMLRRAGLNEMADEVKSLSISKRK
jgi:hypothetical protein